jgi:hypothetical protein
MEVFKSKDLCYLIMYKLINKDLLNFCMMNKYINKLSNNEIFWKNKSQEKYGKIEKLDDITWKNFYKKKLPFKVFKDVPFFCYTGLKCLKLLEFYQSNEYGYILEFQEDQLKILPKETEEALERKLNEIDSAICQKIGYKFVDTDSSKTY